MAEDTLEDSKNDPPSRYVDGAFSMIRRIDEEGNVAYECDKGFGPGFGELTPERVSHLVAVGRRVVHFSSYMSDRDKERRKKHPGLY